MGVDLLRRCYRTKVRFHQGSGELTPIRWFWCDPGAKRLPFYTKFGSGVWQYSPDSPWPGIGESKESGYSFWAGKNLNGKKGIGPPEGTAGQFAEGLAPGDPGPELPFWGCGARQRKVSLALAHRSGQRTGALYRSAPQLGFTATSVGSQGASYVSRPALALLATGRPSWAGTYRSAARYVLPPRLYYSWAAHWYSGPELAFAVTARVDTDWHYVGAGGALGDGAARCGQIVSYTGTGGALGDGAAQLAGHWAYTGAGGALGDGAAPVWRTYPYTGAGGALGDATAPAWRTYPYTGAGGALGDATAPAWRTYPYTGAGGALGDATAPASMSTAGVTVLCSGTPVPNTLTVTESLVFGCPCMSGTSVTITWNGTIWTGTAAMGSCGRTITVTLQPNTVSSPCMIGTVSWPGGCQVGATNFQGTPTSFAPFAMTVGPFTANSTCCNGTSGGYRLVFSP